MKSSFSIKKAIQYFFQGLLVLAPVFITLYALYWIVSSVDNLIPINTFIDDKGVRHVQNYGLGFLVVILLVVGIGYVSSFFITNRIVGLLDRIMMKMPGIKHVYTTTKDFFEAFTGDRNKFSHNVLVSIDAEDVWRLGFVTRDEMSDFDMKDHVAVYVPMSYSVSGNLYIVPKSRIREIGSVNSSQSMKFALSGGITDFEDAEQS
ncbi:MAG: DUF502 domain-containing protein [Ferruginibacter sp.]|nr:DUF502 domain-containing protein [Ferruginibacter sp.]